MNHEAPWQAQWIWAAGQPPSPRNQRIYACREVTLPALRHAGLRISADARYRLWINGEWIQDGPGRCWPTHQSYDRIDVRSALRVGRNVIVVAALHHGFASFQHLPSEAGLLLQLDGEDYAGAAHRLISDRHWRACVDASWTSAAARVFIGQEAVELRDLRVETPLPAHGDAPLPKWPAAAERYAATAGPWRGLEERGTPSLTRLPQLGKAVCWELAVGRCAWKTCIDLHRLCYPSDTSANRLRMLGCLATSVHRARAGTVRLSLALPEGWSLRVNGRSSDGNLLRLRRGENLLVFTVLHEGHGFDATLACETALELRHPWLPDAATPWAWCGPFAPTDPPTNQGTTTAPTIVDNARAEVEALGAHPTSAVLRAAGTWSVVAPELLLEDPWADFRSRRVLATLPPSDHAGLLGDEVHWTCIDPVENGDVELCVDLGLQSIGYVELEADAAAGSIIDVHLVEHLTGEHQPQHTDGVRNGLRWVLREGRQRLTACKRRAGRYLIVSLRELRAPLRLRGLRLLEATYPAQSAGGFRCSDAGLTRIWAMSERTVRLCMEDSYTDCPLYEQVLWVGDLRNEALYAHAAFGAWDLTRRSLRLAAQSLEHGPLVGSQVPSGWNQLLPAWSLLWGIAVQEWYEASGDRAGLAELWPAVIANLRACEENSPRGLLDIHAWNFFDWSGIDCGHDLVLHNSLLLFGALRAARAGARVLGRRDAAWLGAFAKRVETALRQQWDSKRPGFPDALRADGTPSPSTCQHTAALALVHGGLPDAKARRAALGQLLRPRAGTVRAGSPFALQFLLEALEAEDRGEDALALLREHWAVMLAHDASTCWETFPVPGDHRITRSHCHGWSAAPIHVLMRTVLGVRASAPGGRAFTISPQLVGGLDWAEGSHATPLGALSVSWHRLGGTLSIRILAPRRIRCRVQRHASWRRLKVRVERVHQEGVQRGERTTGSRAHDCDPT